VKETGFYSIPVSPELSAYIKTDLSDIRIVNEKGQWVPHILTYPAQNKTNDVVYSILPVIKKENIGLKTVLIIRNQVLRKFPIFISHLKTLQPAGLPL
jgi:hypothetical protein